MRYVGPDAHLRRSTFCVLDDRGRKIVTRTVKDRGLRCSPSSSRCSHPLRSALKPPVAMACSLNGYAVSPAASLCPSGTASSDLPPQAEEQSSRRRGAGQAALF